MTSRLPKSSRVALSLTVAVTAMALGGSAYAQARDPNVRCEGFSDCRDSALGGSLRDAPEGDTTDQPATGQPATNAEPASPPPSADEPQAEAAEGTTPIRRSRATYDSDLAEPE
jgi:hypothetical protein